MEELTMTSKERERLQMFINEQRSEWDARERQKAFLAHREGKKYDPLPFPGFDENAAIQAVRNGLEIKIRFVV